MEDILYLDYKSLEEKYFRHFEILKHRSCKAGSFVVDYTPLSKSKSWAEKLHSASIATRAGGKTQTAMLFWVDECNKLFPRKVTKLLQSYSKQSRLIRVVIKSKL